MNLFNEYKKRRSEDNMTAAQAYKSASYKAAELWRKELRGWDFNIRMILSNMTETHRKVWVHQLPSGHVLMVLASYDYDGVDQLDWLCKLEHHRHKEYRDQEVVSHKDGTYWISTNVGTRSSSWRTAALRLGGTARRAWPSSQLSSEPSRCARRWSTGSRTTCRAT